jgi:hypothetical protein
MQGKQEQVITLVDEDKLAPLRAQEKENQRGLCGGFTRSRCVRLCRVLLCALLISGVLFAPALPCLDDRVRWAYPVTSSLNNVCRLSDRFFSLLLS